MHMKVVKTKSYNFLLEMLIVTVLFTFCCIVFVQLFALSSKKSNDATIYANANRDVQYYASLVQTNSSFESSITKEGYTIEIDRDRDDYHIQAITDDGETILSITVGIVGE